MRASYKHPLLESSSSVAPPPPPSSSDPTVEEYVDPIAAVDSPPSTSSDFGIWSMLDTVMTVQAIYDKLLVDVLMELQALCVNLVSVRQSPPPPPFDDESSLPFGNSSQKIGVPMDGDKGRF